MKHLKRKHMSNKDPRSWVRTQFMPENYGWLNSWRRHTQLIRTNKFGWRFIRIYTFFIRFHRTYFVYFRMISDSTLDTVPVCRTRTEWPKQTTCISCPRYQTDWEAQQKKDKNNWIRGFLGVLRFIFVLPPNKKIQIISIPPKNW